MDSINPTYYAATILNSGFDVVGSNFDLIPNNAIGLYANDNDKPLLFRYSLADNTIYKISRKTNKLISFQAVAPSTTHGDNYLGAIVSEDRNIIYWINNTKPIP